MARPEPTARSGTDRLTASADDVPEGVLGVLRTLHDTGEQAYLAGGCVRDLVMGRVPQDFDVATSARPERVLRLFPHVVPTGLQHGTVTVVLGQGAHDKVEVTTFRGEGLYIDGRRPESVHFLDDVTEDLARRDFTVNAIAWDPHRGELRDPFGGVSDVARRRIRAVGSARERFLEDGLRPMRAVRFASVLGFGLDAATRAAIPETLHVFQRVAMERVRDEFTKLLVNSPRPSRGIELLASTGLLACFLPELLEGKGVIQNRYHRWQVWEHVLRVVDFSAPRTVVRLSALLHDIAKPRCAVPSSSGENSFHRHDTVGAELSREILERLKYPRKTVDAVVHQVRQHNWHYTPEWSDSAVRRRLSELGADALDDCIALRRADVRGRGRRVASGLRNVDELRERFEAELAARHALTLKDLAIGGADVMSLSGTGPGTHVGETLRALLAHVLEHPEDNTRDRLEALVRSQAAAP